jgi:hypothetical protein
MTGRDRHWYALYTRSRHEKRVEAVLRRLSLETYLPLRRAWSRGRDRRGTVELPALPGYLFVRCVLSGETRARLKKTAWVVPGRAGGCAVRHPRARDRGAAAGAHARA